MIQKIQYLKIQNFKVFGEEIKINFDKPTVLIGANNSGKTSAIQALALWNWAIKIWTDKRKNKSKNERNRGVALNRLDIAQVPIKETRYFWNNAKVRQNRNDNITLSIKVGLFYKNKIEEVGIIFKYHSPDLIYCQPTEETFLIDGILEFAQNLKINLLYPMSGISDKEFVLQEEAIRTQIGIGQTANVLRNICYHLYTNNEKDWTYLVGLIKILFSIEFKNPITRATGVIELQYNYTESSKKTDYDLDITLAGRGQQQMLLVLAYLLANKGSILMIDEPDAHLEILRQAQVFNILKEVAQKSQSQIVIVTHSEVVLNEANSVIFLANGTAQEISDKKEFKYIKDALKNFGIEHYYKAKLKPHILYVESSTDKEMLKTFAQKFNHKAKLFFEEKLNFYYTKNEIGINNLENELQISSGHYKPLKSHFQALKRILNNLKGIGIFDNDNRNRQDEVQEDLGIFYWKMYELENYFISPKTILLFAQKEWQERGYDDLFLQPKLEQLEIIIENELILPVLNNDKKALKDFKELPKSLQNVQFQNLSTTKKVSELAENVFRKLAEEENEPILVSKGNFYQLIEFVDDLPQEVNEKLNLIEKYLKED